jgi:hypothetical protein
MSVWCLKLETTSVFSIGARVFRRIFQGWLAFVG